MVLGFAIHNIVEVSRYIVGVLYTIHQSFLVLLISTILFAPNSVVGLAFLTFDLEKPYLHES